MQGQRYDPKEAPKPMKPDPEQTKGPRMAQSIDDPARGARLARRDEGDILAGM